jgi:hypothetical protein
VDASIVLAATKKWLIVKSWHNDSGWEEFPVQVDNVSPASRSVSWEFKAELASPIFALKSAIPQGVWEFKPELLLAQRSELRALSSSDLDFPRALGFSKATCSEACRSRDRIPSTPWGVVGGVKWWKSAGLKFCQISA